VASGELKDAVEYEAAAARGAPVEPEDELVEVGLEMPQATRSVWTRRYPYVPSESSNDFFTTSASIPRLFAVADSGAFRHS